MVEVLTYATEEEADSDLERTFDRNNTVIDELEGRFGQLSDVSKWKEVGEQYELDCVTFLGKIAGKYSYASGVRYESEFVSPETYSTLDELVNGVKKIINSGAGYAQYGINVNPVFFNIANSEVLSKSGAMVILRTNRLLNGTESESYKSSEKITKETFKDAISVKVEGLSPYEIAEFERLYDEGK
jgi:hypothetical protein